MKRYCLQSGPLLFLLLSFSCSTMTARSDSPRVSLLMELPPPITSEAVETFSDGYDSPAGNVDGFDDKAEIDGCLNFGDCPVSSEKAPRPESLHTEGGEETPPLQVDALEEVKEEKGQNLLDSAMDFINASQEYWSEGNLEKAIATLDEAYALVVQVDTDSNPDLVQQQDDLRFTISRRILEIYASRYTAVNGNHNEIPLTLNEHVEKEIELFTGPERQFFIESYQRSGRYMPGIIEALREAGLPVDLAWLPLIESGFKTGALSRARALGLWQFIPSTGYKFGLKRDTWIDERLDPDKSTAAAIAYLKELHKIFGDWTTVLAGYNCGEGTVLKRIRNQRINYLDNFWDLYEQLPRETARYVPRFLATLHILSDPQKYGFAFDENDAPLLYETVAVKRPVQLKAVASTTGISLEDLTDLNPELRQRATPPYEYALKVPQGKSNLMLAHLDQIPRWEPPKNEYVYHRVRRGETLSTIALRYRTSISNIARANNIRKKHFIRVGQKLKIPLRGSAVARAYRSSETNGTYRVKKGDSLWLIAKRFNTNTETLQQINSLSSTSLKVGQVLKVER